MKRFLFLLSCSAALANAADLTAARTVYVLSMPRGLDQFLANRLTNDHVLQVVTDPKLADVILTDHLGEGFQAQLEKISPTPVDDSDAEPPAKPAKDDQKADPPANSLLAPPVNQLDNPVVNSSFGHNKGTIFLVDAKSREVLWSVFEPPKTYDPKAMDHTAAEIVNRLKKDLGKK